MKIAICISGHLRNFEKSLPSFQYNFLNHYDCDIFVHTWDRMGYGSAYRSDNRQDLTQAYLPAFQTQFKPKKIIVEDSKFVEELKLQGNQYAPHLMHEPKHVGHMASMFYKIYACNELRKQFQIETGTQYDWIIRTRADLMFYQRISLPEQSNNQVYLAQAQCQPGWLNDQFAIGGSSEMDLYSSAFFHLNEYFTARMEFYPEKYMDWVLKKVGLSPKFHNLHFSIMR